MPFVPVFDSPGRSAVRARRASRLVAASWLVTAAACSGYSSPDPSNSFWDDDACPAGNACPSDDDGSNADGTGQNDDSPGDDDGDGVAPPPEGGGNQPATGGAGGAVPGSGGSGTGGATTSPGGYIKSGSWQGYAWTAVGGKATVGPADFRTSTGFPLCAKGQVETGDSNVAMVGWNLNQGSKNGEPALTVAPTLGGILIKVSNPGASPLRLQIQGPKGATDANDRWCAAIPGTGGFIAFDAFNTECWAGGMGTGYAGQPIVAAIVLVPGNAMGSTNFDFCVNEIVESNQNGPPVGTGCSLAGGPGEGGGSISGDETRSVTRAGRNYIVQNNVWNGNKQAQRLNVTGVAFEVQTQGNSGSTQGAPASFPSTFIGSNWNRRTMNSNLPKRVGDLGKVPTAWRWKAAGGGQWNAAYDVWFSTGPGGDSGNPSAAYLMVWLFDPTGAQPLGSPAGTESVAGRSWQVWTCPGACQNGVPVISYIPANNQAIPELSFDLNDFIKNAKTKYPNMMKDAWFLTNIFAGFEIWNGGVGLRTDDFCAVVE